MATLLGAATLVMLCLPSLAWAQPAGPVQVSSDPYSNPESQHQTQVEADTVAFGGAVLSAFMVARMANGAANIGWAFSPDAGVSWSSGFLPGLTVHGSPQGPATRVADPSATYDAAHGVWLINSLALREDEPVQAAQVVNRSTDGVTWAEPVVVAPYRPAGEVDKNWITCDNFSASPFYGSCYVAWTDFVGDTMHISRSVDGGQSWSGSVRPAGGIFGFGAQPVVQPDGTVVIVALDRLQQNMLAVKSTDGGASFGSAVTISEVRHRVPPGYRNNPFPSVEVDAAGRIYAAWQDCRFRNLCLGGNDTVMSTSMDGSSWSPVKPVRWSGGDVSEGSDRLQVGLAAEPASAGRLGVYFYYTGAPCRVTGGCELNVGFTSSFDGGATWSPATLVSTRPMPLEWFARTDTGRMTGDYISASFANGRVVSVLALADPPAPDGTLRQAMHGVTAEVVPQQGPGAGPSGDPDGLVGLVTDLLTLLFQLLPRL